jgi:DNA-binding NtrC family response regulator
MVVVAIQNQEDAEDAACWLQRTMASKKPVPTLLICDADQSELALPLIRLGAVDCLSRPLDTSRLVYLLDLLTVRARLAKETAPLPVQYLGEDKSYLCLPASPSARIVEQLRRVAPLTTSILLQGETGTGKTHLARLIHELSPRAKQPFLVVNCGALSGNVIESEMFGHVRGAFTGADRDRVGKFAAAGAGTIFLDDMNALPLELQAKLLRVVEDRVFEPLGSNRRLDMKARLIVASNAVLSDEVAAGRFRADLYYRLCVVAFCLPPLRENLDIIPALAMKFLADFSAIHGRPTSRIDPAALDALKNYLWPGNIRELRNLIERAVALSTGRVIQKDDLLPYLTPVTLAEMPSIRLAAAIAQAPTALAQGPTEIAALYAGPSGALAGVKQAAEAGHIIEALTKNNNNRLRAAAALGISRTTLYNKMRLYGLSGAIPA